MCLLHILPIKILPRSSQRQGLHSTSEGVNSATGSSHSTSEETKARVHTTLEERQECKQRRQSPASSLHHCPGKSQQSTATPAHCRRPGRCPASPPSWMFHDHHSHPPPHTHLALQHSTCSCGTAEGNRDTCTMDLCTKLPLKQVSPAPFVKGESGSLAPKCNTSSLNMQAASQA